MAKTILHFEIDPALEGSEVYLVGGAVRDHVLKQPIKDADFVVVGKSPQDMIDLGFSMVGKDFPVFLSPKTKHEYALARIERKTGHGYNGFSVECEGVTLAQDLSRRDLTMNAMAMGQDGQIIDPFNGLKDIENKVLRHVSSAFSEDPLRVLRVARFAARYAPLGFTVAPETITMMKGMVENGEVDHLVAERIWQEFVKNCSSPKPSIWLKVLHEIGALERILPEVSALYGVPQNPMYHPEVDTGIHTEMVVDAAAGLSQGDPEIIFAALVHDLGKGKTPSAQWPQHIDHEELGLEPVEDVCKRLRVPRQTAQLAKLVCRYHLNMHRCLEMKTGRLLNLLEKTDAFRKPEQLKNFILTCQADKQGRLGFEQKDYPQKDLLTLAYQHAKAVSGRPFAEMGLPPLEIQAKVRDARLRAIRQAQYEFSQQQKNKTETQNAELETQKKKMSV